MLVKTAHLIVDPVRINKMYGVSFTMLKRVVFDNRVQRSGYDSGQ